MMDVVQKDDVKASRTSTQSVGFGIKASPDELETNMERPRPQVCVCAFDDMILFFPGVLDATLQNALKCCKRSGEMKITVGLVRYIPTHLRLPRIRRNT
jgi:hypothetical protein